MLLLNTFIHGLLVKWLNTLPSQGNIHGFEFRTGYHIIITRASLVFLCINKQKKIRIVGEDNMTEKELLYVEDGINHETSIITILNETENCVKENDLK